MTDVLDGYIRVSRVGGREGDSYISPGVQREAIERWAEYKGVKIGEWLVDEDQTGGSHDRPALIRGITRAIAGDTQGIVSWKIDRFSRQTEGGLRDLRRLQDADARLVFVTEDVDTATVYGRMIYTILLAVSEAFLENIKDSWQIAKTRAAGRGAYISRTPFGFAKDDAARLIPHPKEAPLVTEAYRLAATRDLNAATFYLQEHAPERRWTAGTVRRMLARQANLGHIVNGTLVELDKHEPLTTPAMWAAAQTTPAPRRPALEFPLSGALTCTTCQKPMTGGRGGKGQRTYRCATRHAGGTVVTAQNVEEWVIEKAQEYLGDLVVQVGATDVEGLEEISLELAEAESELEMFAADITLRSALGSVYHRHLQERVQRVSELRGQLGEMSRSGEAELEFSAEDLTLDDPELLAAALCGLWERIEVKPGRGLGIGQRVRFVAPDDADTSAGEAVA